MSCSTAVTTNWTPSTSHVTATSTTVVTSVSTPQPSVSTTLVTSCVSTRRSTARSLPTGRSTVPDTSGQADDLTVAAATRSNRDRDRDRSSSDSESSTISTPSLWTLLRAASSQQDDTLARRQVPEGLPENCARWTVTASFSTISAAPTTTLSTTTTLSSSVTTIWQAKETVYSACPTENSFSESSASASSTVSSTTSPSEASSTPISTSESSSIESSTQHSIVPSEINGQTSSADSAAALSSGTGTWVDELSRFSNMTAASQTASASADTSSILATVSVQTIDTMSNGTLIPIVIPTSSLSAVNSAAILSTSISGSRTRSVSQPISSHTADSGAATQAAMAKEGDDKAVSAGAAVGGIVGMLLLIGGILFALRWWMRYKRGNKRKTILMRQSWYPAGYDGPDHIAETSREKTPSRRGDNARSFFSISGNGAGINTPSGNSGSPTNETRRFPGLALAKMPFFKRGNNQEIVDDEYDSFSSGSPNPVSMPPMFNQPSETRSKGFPTLTMPWTQAKTPSVPAWAEKYTDDSPSQSARQLGDSAPSNHAPLTARQDRQADVPRSILARTDGFDGLPGPPRLDYEPAGGHMSWGLNKSNAGTPPRTNAALSLALRPQLEWGHSYAASTVNPNPRDSVMPPNPRPFVPGPDIPPSPTEESVYSRRESHRSHGSRVSVRQSRQSHHSRVSRDVGAADLGRKPSRTSNPDLRSAILSRASASVASLGHLSFQSGTTDHSLPPLPEGGLRLDFPLPPSPSTRVPTMTFPTPRISVPNAHTGPAGAPNRSLVPSRPSIKGAGLSSNSNYNEAKSSIFEYADYSRTSGWNGAPTAGPSEPSARDTIRQTADWYEKPLWVWDGQSGPLPPIPNQGSNWDGQSWRQSRKSVRWDPADDIARAL